MSRLDSILRTFFALKLMFYGCETRNKSTIYCIQTKLKKGEEKELKKKNNRMLCYSLSKQSKNFIFNIESTKNKKI